MKRIILTICLAVLLLGTVPTCGGGGGPGRDVCSWGYYWDPYTEQYLYYRDCYDAYKVTFFNDEGHAQFWDQDDEAGSPGGLIEFQAELREQGYRPLLPQSQESQ